MCVAVELASEQGVRQPPRPDLPPGSGRSESYQVEADGKTSDRRVFQIAGAYSNGDFSLTGSFGAPGAYRTEVLRFSVAAEEATVVRRRLSAEPDVLRVWLEDEYLDT